MNRLAWILLGVGLVARAASVQAAPNEMHPPFAVLDGDGRSILLSGQSPSSTATCGACHDTAWIDRNNAHVTERVHADCVDCHLDDGRLPTQPDAFDAEGRLKRSALVIRAPRDAACGRCHGLVHEGPEPLSLPADYETAPTPEAPWRTYDLTRGTGEIVSGQDVSASYLNLVGKDELDLPWDAHARRGVGCTACHFAPNNPARASLRDSGLEVVGREPRRLGTSEYLRRPDHRLAVATCTACHEPLKAHDFLPYRKRHLSVLACQACHVPVLRGPAVQAEDATIVLPSGRPRVELRGLVRHEGVALNAELLTGYAPFLLSPAEESGGPRLAPYNLVTRWEWVSRDTGEPVAPSTLAQAWQEGGRVAPSLLASLDTDGDGELAPGERVLDTPAKTEVVRARLVEAGVGDPVVRAHVRAVPVNHGVVSGAWVRRDCEACHAEGGRLDQPLVLAASTPAGVLPLLDPGPLALAGAVRVDAAKGVVLERDHAACRFYVFGVSCVEWPGRVGFALFALTVLGIVVHGGLRARARRANPAVHGKVQKVYLYTAYERFWHWVMAASVLVLLVTGFEVHGRGDVGLFGIPLAVRLHDVFAVVLIANAFLSLFYHVTSSAIRQFFPPRDNLQGEMAAQARYYLRGIFLGHPHPTPKSLERKLNPLQQVTYLGLLNVLFPFQVVTGVLMWGVSEWPDLATSLGGLSVVAPLHNLGSWLFLTFFVLHVYLTTTGRTVLSNLSAMIDGWEEIDVPATAVEGGSDDR